MDPHASFHSAQDDDILMDSSLCSEWQITIIYSVEDITN